MDAPESGAPSLPQLPADLDNAVALEQWRATWNAWIAEQAGTGSWPWLRPITRETLREIVGGEKQLRTDIARGRQEVELGAARNDLNALGDHLRATDPQYEAKRALLAPILKPIFRHIPPSNWKALFEQAYARLQIPIDDQAQEQGRELEEGRSALNALEDRLKEQDPGYDAKKAVLLPILKPLFKRIPPSKWAAAYEEVYAGFRLPAESTVAQREQIVPTAQSACATGVGSDRAVLFEPRGQPGEIGFSRGGLPAAGSAWLLNFSEPLWVFRRFLGVSNRWIGTAIDLGVPITHEELTDPARAPSYRIPSFRVNVVRSDPMFEVIRALWKPRYRPKWKRLLDLAILVAMGVAAAIEIVAAALGRTAAVLVGIFMSAGFVIMFFRIRLLRRRGAAAGTRSP